MVTSMKIPPELADNIMDYLYDDKHALAHCSLVCRAWLPPTRYHLFRKISLRPWDADGFLELLDSPHCTILNFVRDLHIAEGGGRFGHSDRQWVHEAMPILVRLFAVESLHIRDWSLEGLGVKEKAMLPSGFKQVKTLDLTSVHLDTFERAVELLSAFPALERICFDFVRWAEFHVPEPTHPTVAFPLRTLDLGSCHKAPVLSWLLSQQCASHVESLKLHDIQLEDVPYVVNFLRATNSSLHQIDLSFKLSDSAPGRCASSVLPVFLLLALTFTSYSIQSDRGLGQR